MDAIPVACLVYVEYTSPSVRHVPWLLPIGKEPALRVLLRRLGRWYPTAHERVVICADATRLDAARASAVPEGWRVLAPLRPLLIPALAEFAHDHADSCDVMVFPATAVVPEPDACDRLLRLHRQANTDITAVADPLLDGLVPIIVRSPLPTTSNEWGGASSTKQLLEMVRRSVASDVRVSLHPKEQVVDAADLEFLPAAPEIGDCWTQSAATAAAFGSGAKAARIFKHAILASREEVPPVRIARRQPIANAPLTVLFSSLRIAFSGAEQSLCALMTHFDEHRYRPVALLPFESLLAERLRRAGIEVHVAGWNYSEVSPRNLTFCETVLERLEPDVVHVDLAPNASLMVSARAAGIPVVAHARTVPEDKLAPLVTMADRMIAVSELVARQLRRFDSIGPDRIVTIHNGVACDSGSPADTRAYRRSLGIPEDAFVVTTVSRLTPPKKIDVLLAAMARVLAAAPQGWVLIVGEPYPSPSDLAYAERLRAQAVEAGIASRVTWIPFEPEIQRIFAISDALVLCSTYDALGRCVLEALAAGVPAIVPDVGSATELVEAERSGLVFHADSPDSLASTLTRLIADPRLGARVRTEGQRRAAELFSIQRHVAAVQALYDDVCANARHHVPHAQHID